MGSPFASQHTRTVSVPGDPDNTVVIRKLPGRHLERAAQEHFFRSTDVVKRIGGPRFQKEMEDAMAAPVDPEKPAPDVKPDPLIGYDKQTLLYKGIVSWSYPQSLKPETVNGEEVIAAIDDLDDDAYESLARDVLKLAKPSLFQTEAEAEAAQKNG